MLAALLPRERHRLHSRRGAVELRPHRAMFAFETYGLEPDIVVLGKGLGNGVPVAAAVGRSDVFGVARLRRRLRHLERQPALLRGRAGDARRVRRRATCSARCRRSSAIIEEGLVALKELPFVAHVRGEKGGMVWGVETQRPRRQAAADWANALVLACYRGENGGDGIHLLGPLAKKVVRIAPPLTITEHGGASGDGPDDAMLAAAFEHSDSEFAGISRVGPDQELNPGEFELQRFENACRDHRPAVRSNARAMDRSRIGTAITSGRFCAVLLVSLICGLVGALVVGNRMAFFCDAMAHCAFAGIALGLLIAIAMGYPTTSDELQWLHSAGHGRLRRRRSGWRSPSCGNRRACQRHRHRRLLRRRIGFGAMILQAIADRAVCSIPESSCSATRPGPADDILILAVVLAA